MVRGKGRIDPFKFSLKKFKKGVDRAHNRCYNIDNKEREVERKKTMKKVVAYAVREKNTNRIIKVGDKYEIFDAIIKKYSNDSKYEMIALTE